MAHTSSQLPEQAAMDLPPMATNAIPSPHPTPAVTSADDSGPFLRAPREIRDTIYRFLLSTEHTKEYEGEPEIDSLRRDYTYRFHTAIFYTSRQVYNEASNVFYMENLFIRVNLDVRSVLVSKNFAGFKGYFPRGSRLPVVSWSTKVLACKRHVMDLNVGAEDRWQDSLGHRHFILACDDLPIFSRALLRINGYGTCLLPTMELSIIIGDQVGTVGKESHDSNTSTDGNPKELLSAATKKATMKGDSSTMIRRIKDAKSRWSQRRIYVDNRRVRSLLEPLRLLYDIGNLYIDAPVSEQYWLEIFNTLSGPQPSIHVIYTALYTALDEAVAIYHADDMAFAILKLRGVMDTMNDISEHCGDEDLSTVVMTGQNTGLTYWDIHAKMQCLIWNILARANLSFSEDLQHVRTAWHLTLRIIGKCRCYQLGSKDADFEHDNVYFLESMVWEALDQLGEYNDVPRSHALRVVVKSLRKAIRQEPGNAMLEKELQSRLIEKREAKMVEDVRKLESDEGKVMNGHLTN